MRLKTRPAWFITFCNIPVAKLLAVSCGLLGPQRTKTIRRDLHYSSTLDFKLQLHPSHLCTTWLLNVFCYSFLCLIEQKGSLPFSVLGANLFLFLLTSINKLQKSLCITCNIIDMKFCNYKEWKVWWFIVSNLYTVLYIFCCILSRFQKVLLLWRTLLWSISQIW